MICTYTLCLHTMSSSSCTGTYWLVRFRIVHITAVDHLQCTDWLSGSFKCDSFHYSVFVFCELLPCLSCDLWCFFYVFLWALTPLSQCTIGCKWQINWNLTKGPCRYQMCSSCQISSESCDYRRCSALWLVVQWSHIMIGYCFQQPVRLHVCKQSTNLDNKTNLK